MARQARRRKGDYKAISPTARQPAANHRSHFMKRKTGRGWGEEGSGRGQMKGRGKDRREWETGRWGKQVRRFKPQRKRRGRRDGGRAQDVRQLLRILTRPLQGWPLTPDSYLTLKETDLCLVTSTEQTGFTIFKRCSINQFIKTILVNH